MQHTLRPATTYPIYSIFLLSITVLWTLMPSAAYATGLTMDNCAPGFQPHQFTAKLVACVENSVINATMSMMGSLSSFMRPTASAIFTLAIAVLGIRIASGEKMGRAGMYIVRLTMISFFIFNLSSFAGAIFSIENELVGMVSVGGSPWGMIDNFIGNLIGFGPQIALFQGVLSLVGAALGGYSVGAMLFGAGVSAIVTLLKFAFNVVYTYLASIIMLGFLIVLSPIFLPFAVFFITERYMKKLLDMIISIMMMPILLFAFISMFLGIFDSLISDIFDNALPANKDWRALWNVNNPVFSWVMPSDTSLMNRMQAFQSMDAEPPAAIPPVQTNVNPFLRHGFNAGVSNFSGLNFGPAEPIWVQTLAMKFIALYLFASIMKTMVNKIPEISSSIAGSVISIPLSATSPSQMMKNVEKNFNAGAGALLGGAAGNMVGTAGAKATGGGDREQALAGQGGGISGAIAGMMVTSRSKIQ